MKNLKFLSPAPLPFDLSDWKQQPFSTRVRWLCEAWATQGYGAPVGVYSFYLLKIGFYIGMWIFFCGFSANLGAAAEIGTWWYVPEALLKAVLWSIVLKTWDWDAEADR